MNTLEILAGLNLLAIIFGAGALWQRVNDFGRRIGRIEDKLNNESHDN